jgi:CheY-like chemotaxis protein
VSDLRSAPAEVVTAPILLLEDERATAALIAQLLAAERITNRLEVVDSGAAALSYLERVVSGEASMPVLCVLDLSLPDMSGLEVLRNIRATPALARLTVIMLTGSGNDADIDTAYDLGIDAYLIKPAGVHGLPDVVRELHLPYALIIEPERSDA